MDEPRNRLVIVTVTLVAFFAIMTSQKAAYYMVHLTTWFALAVGLMMSDGVNLIGRLKTTNWKGSRLPALAYRASLIGALTFAGVFSYQVVKLYTRYLGNVRNPDLAQFYEFRTAIGPWSLRMSVLWKYAIL